MPYNLTDQKSHPAAGTSLHFSTLLSPAQLHILLGGTHIFVCCKQQLSPVYRRARLQRCANVEWPRLMPARTLIDKSGAIFKRSCRQRLRVPITLLKRMAHALLRVAYSLERELLIAILSAAYVSRGGWVDNYASGTRLLLLLHPHRSAPGRWAPPAAAVLHSIKTTPTVCTHWKMERKHIMCASRAITLK